MTQPSDTDRLIAAQRQEAHRTRVLLAWLLIGIPAILLIGWGAIAGLAATGHRPPSNTDATIPVVQTADPMPTALLNTIDNTTSCAAVDEWATDGALDAYTGGFDVGSRAQFEIECRLNSSELAGQALLKAAGARAAIPTG